MKKSIKLLSLTLGVSALIALTLGAAVFAEPTDEADSQNAQITVTQTTDNNDEQTVFTGHRGARISAEERMCEDVLTEILGISQQELCDLRLEGNSLAEIAASQGVDLDELTEALIETRTAAIQSALADGTISQAEADWMLSGLAQRIDAMLHRIAGSGGGGSMGYGAGNQHRGGRSLDTVVEFEEFKSGFGEGKQHRGQPQQ